MIAFDAFTLEELDLVLLGLVSDEYLLDIAHVAVLHLILQTNLINQLDFNLILESLLLQLQSALTLSLQSYYQISNNQAMVIIIYMQPDIVDYRNGKYQGPLNSHKQRHGLGIFIDDDLAFHISEWQLNQLNGSTLVYLTHGKYMYGEWKKNQPHGLNVYRSGDTVLLSNFKLGIPSQRCILIFETHNFACVLVQNNGQWKVSQSGPIPNHQILLSYIQQVGFAVPECYFSLTKFACSFSNMNKSIKTFPCQANFCYFGYINGLAIVFNPNNGVVSVGHHRNQVLSEFGGKFEGIKKAQEGNFEVGGEVITYQGQRPINQIYNIYQYLHKKSLNFHNHYFDSKSKVFNSIQSILRGKLKQIVEQGMKRHQFTNLNLNDSLDFHDYNEEQSIKIYQNRQRMYSPPKKDIEKGTFKVDRSQATSKNSKQPNISNLPLRSISYNDVQLKQQQQQLQFSSNHKQKEFKSNSSNIRHLRPYNMQENQQSLPSQKKSQSFYKYRPQIPQRKDKREFRQQDSGKSEIQANQAKPLQIEQIEKKNYPQRSKIFEQPALRSQFSKKTYNVTKTHQKEPLFPKNKTQADSTQRQRSPTFKGLIQEMENKYKLKHPDQLHSKQQILSNQKNQKLDQTVKPSQFSCKEEAQQIKPRSSTLERNKKFDIKTLPRPTYQEIEERRKRVLRDFQELNNNNQVPASKSEYPPSENMPSTTCYPIRRKESQQSTFAFIPLSISNKQRLLTPKKETPFEKQPQKCRDKKSYSRIPSQLSTPVRKKSSSQFVNPVVEKRIRPINDQNFEASHWKGQDKERKIMGSVQTEGVSKSIAGSSHQNSISPSRQKRTYVYLFQ